MSSKSMWELVSELMEEEEDTSYDFDEIELDDFIVWVDDQGEVRSGFVTELCSDEEHISAVRVPPPRDIPHSDIEKRKDTCSVLDIVQRFQIIHLATSEEVV